MSLNDERWDAICVGSGITALAFAAQMAALAPKRRILILEKHYSPGGYATWFRRGKLVFDCSLHKLSGVGAGGNLKRIFDALGLTDELEFVYPTDFFEADREGRTTALSNEYPAFKAQLLEMFPTETEGLGRFFEELEIHGKNAYLQFQIMNGDFLPDVKQLRHARKHLSRITVAQALDDRFRDPFLKQLLSAPGIYVGGFEEDLGYLYYLHILYATLTCGNAYVKGSSQRLSNLLAARVRKAGGAVLLRTEVSSISVDESGRASGVETSRGHFRSDRVYVNASPQFAMERLLPPMDCLTPAREKLATLKPSWSTTTLYLATDAPPAALGLANSETMFFSARAGEASALRQASALTGSESSVEDALWSASTMEVTNYHRLDPAGGNVICLNVLDRLAHWPERETLEYEAKKARAGRVLLERFLAQRPAFAGHILHQELSSPRTYQRYTNNHAGAGYGALVGPDASGHTFHYNFPIPGIHFLSAWVAGPSYEAAFGYAEMKARSFEDA